MSLVFFFTGIGVHLTTDQFVPSNGGIAGGFKVYFLENSSILTWSTLDFSF